MLTTPKYEVFVYTMAMSRELETYVLRLLLDAYTGICTYNSLVYERTQLEVKGEGCRRELSLLQACAFTGVSEHT